MLCRRENAVPAPASADTVPDDVISPPPGADGDRSPDSAGSAALASSASRQISVRLPPSVLLLPLVAAGFYYFAFFAGSEPTSPPDRSEELASAPPKVAAERPAPLDDSAGSRSSFEPLVIEEPDTSARRVAERAEPESAPGTAPRGAAANTRGLERARRDAEARELATLRERVDVTVYYTTWCPACRQLRSYLTQQNIRATEYDVERNRSASLRQRQLNPRGSVPTIEIDGQVLVGFSAQRLEAALDRAARERLERL